MKFQCNIFSFHVFKYLMLNCCRVHFVLLCGVELRLLLRNLVKNCSPTKIKCGLVIVFELEHSSFDSS